MKIRVSFKSFSLTYLGYACNVGVHGEENNPEVNKHIPVSVGGGIGK